MSRRTVATGVARMPSGSHTATPMRALPRSMPRRRPRRHSVAAGPGCSWSTLVLSGDRAHDVVEQPLGLVGGDAAALGDVLVAAAATRQGRLDEVGRADVPRLRGRVGGHDDAGLAA